MLTAMITGRFRFRLIQGLGFRVEFIIAAFASHPSLIEWLKTVVCFSQMNFQILMLGAAFLLGAVGVRASDGVGVTETSIEQDKPGYVLETRYFHKADGSNDYKICLAYVTADPKFNPPNRPVYDPGVRRGEVDELFPGFAEVPSGTPLVLHQGASLRGRPQVISIEKLKATKLAPSANSTNPPNITITSPTEKITSRPMINLRGASEHPLRSIHFDVLNTIRSLTNRQGFVTDAFFDTALWKETTNYWVCQDIGLALGSNTIVVRCEDFAGRVTTTNLVYVLRLGEDKTPPRISLTWPRPGTQISGSSFFAIGQLDDESTKIVGRISGDEQTAVANGIVERTGRFWVEHIPLPGKTNQLTLTAIDPSGNVNRTNLEIIRSETTLVINQVPSLQLLQLKTKVTGSVNPPDQEVWVNGLKATVKPGGDWVAEAVPMTQGGTALFRAVAIRKLPPLNAQAAAVAPPDMVLAPVEPTSIQSTMPTQNIVLNIDQPTSKAVTVHLTGTAGKSFILSASTNLIDWEPILTNINSGATFDYADTNITPYGCRFFCVIPIH